MSSSTPEPFRGAASEWDGFVRGQPGWTHFHLHGWKPIMEGVLGHRCTYLSVRGPDGALEGVLPLVRVKSLIFGHFLVSMPFLNYGGPLGTPGAVASLVKTAAELARREGAGLLELRSRHEQDAPGLTVSHRKITVVRDLVPGDPEAVWSDLKPKVRSQVRRPRKEGVEVRSGPEELAPFYDVFARHMRDLGTPVQSRRLFQAIAETFPDDVRFACAYLDGEPVAGGCGFRWGDEFEMTWASSLREHNRIAPNMLLYWSMMEDAARDGLRTFNFGRCTPGSGTHRFKGQWGGRDEQLWWYQWSRSGEEAATPSPDAGLFALATRAWSRLPVPVTRLLGPRIVRWIP